MEISMDPIIVFYENMVKKTQADLKLPEFSEIYLRLAFKVVLGKDYRIDLNLLPLQKQINVIWLSKVITDLVLLEHESGISQAYISHILAHEEEILNRWLNASGCSKNIEKNKNRKEAHECDVIDRILFEWVKRKMQNYKRTVYPHEIELQAKVIKQQLNVPKYPIGMGFWNRYYNHKLSLNERFNQSLSLDTGDILGGIFHEIDLATYTKFNNLLKKCDRIKSIEAKMGSLNEAPDVCTEGTECVDVPENEEGKSDAEVRNRDEIKAVNSDLPKKKEAERSDQVTKKVVNVMPIEEPENAFEESFYTCNGNKDVIVVKDNELYKRIHVTNPIEQSAEDEPIRQEVIDILAELQEEIEAEESRSFLPTEHFSVGSITASPSTSIILDANYGNIQMGSPHSIQNEDTLIPQTTDSIEELVQKYEFYKSQQQNLHISKIHCGHNEFLNNTFIDMGEMRNKMQSKEKILNDKLPQQVLIRDASGSVDKTDILLSPADSEYPCNNFTEVVIKKELKGDIAMDSNISDHQENLQKTISKFEKSELSHQENNSDGILNNLEHTAMENDTPLECGMSKNNSYFGIIEEESNIIAEDICHVDNENSEITLKESRGVLKTEYDRQSLSSTRNNQKKERFDILLEPIAVTETSPKHVKQSKQDNVQIAKELENCNDSEDDDIQVVETTSDDEDVDEYIVDNDSHFNHNNNVKDTIQAYTIMEDLRHRNMEKVFKSKAVIKARRDKRRRINKPKASKKNTEIAKTVSLKRRNLTSEDNGLKRLCTVSDSKNTSPVSKPVLKKTENDSHVQEDGNTVHSLDDESALDCNFGDNEDSELITLIEIVSDEEDDAKSLLPSELNTNAKPTGSESTTEDRAVMGSPSYSVNEKLNTSRQDAFLPASRKDGAVHVLSTVMDRNCRDSIESLDDTRTSCISNLSQFSIIELSAQESTQASINEQKSRLKLLQTDVDASTYLYKLRDFLVRQKDYEAFKLAVNLQMAFLMPKNCKFKF